MAALALTVVSGWCFAQTTAVAADGPTENKINLQLQIAGLGPEGCTVDIKPGHAGCQFAPVQKRVAPEEAAGVVVLPTIAIVARSTGADRDCSFAITIKEPGKSPKTFRRGIRLAARAAGESERVQNLKVYLSAPSIAAKDQTAGARR
jgi:hypothetical protein